jgi:signal transduction histidine kinase
MGTVLEKAREEVRPPIRVTSGLKSYSLATAICFAAAVLSSILHAPSSCFHLAIVICSLYLGRRAGLLAVILSILSFDYFFLPPRFHFVAEPSSYPRFVAFIATAVSINLVIAAKQRGDRARLQAIEERKAARDSLQKVEERLARAAQIATLGEVSASIAHEINQPLTAIIANAHMCFESLSSDPVAVADARGLVQEILHCGYGATDVVRRMRTLFKGGVFEKAPLDINEVAREVILLIRSEAEKREVNLEVDLEGGLPAILGDRVQIQQVLVNLCINGLDAMDSVVDRRRTLSLRTIAHDQGAIRVEVQDTGIGLRDQDRVFEAFYTTKRDGMGMGLPISRSIIESHSGRLWPQAGNNPGTTFCFTLPVCDDSKPEAHPLNSGCPSDECVSAT